MQVAPPTLAAPDSTAPAPRRLVAATALRLSRIIALALVWAAAIVILGWILDVGLLKGMLPGLIWMKVNTALGFARPPPPSRRWAGGTLSPEPGPTWPGWSAASIVSRGSSSA